MSIFQSTLPRGSDRGYTYQCETCRYFNPRSLAGATYLIYNFTNRCQISIHAPSRERPAGGTAGLMPMAFQSTLPRGSDVSPGITSSTKYDFNPRSLAGATRFVKRLCCKGTIFQSTLPRGSDLQLSTSLSMGYDFNPRSLAGATTRLMIGLFVASIFQSTLPRGSDLLI